MKRRLNVEFHELETGSGIVDIAIRYDTNTGRYNFVLEENGLPTTLPMHVFNGILACIQMEACRGVIDGFRAE